MKSFESCAGRAEQSRRLATSTMITDLKGDISPSNRFILFL
jgi:hypothetical protein